MSDQTLVKPIPTTPPQLPCRVQYIGGNVSEYPWHEQYRLTNLYPDAIQRVTARIMTWKNSNALNARHFYPIIKIPSVPFWDGTGWRELHTESVSYREVSIEAAFDLSHALQHHTRFRHLDLVFINKQVKKAVPLPIREHNSDPIDCNEFGYFSMENAEEWIDAVWEILLEPLSFYVLHYDFDSGMVRKYDPRFRHNGD